MSAKIDGIVKFAGYQIVEHLYSGSRTQVYRAIRELDCHTDVNMAFWIDINGLCVTASPSYFRYLLLPCAVTHSTSIN